MRPVLRFIAAVFLTSGVLLLLDAGVTLAWQEPLSALVAGREQGRLDAELGQTTRGLAGDRGQLEGRLPAGPRLTAALAARERRRAREGDPIGRIELPTLRRAYTMVQGTSTPTLRKGPGHYPGTPLPGQRGTVAVAGHRTTYLAPFRTINRLRPGDPIVVVMPYGRFTYRVERTRIVLPTAVWVKRRVSYDRLVLSACHPLYSATRRIVVFSRLEAPTAR